MSSGGALVRLNFASRSAIFAADALAFEALIFDPTKGEFVAIPLVLARSGARNQRAITSGPVIIGPNDQIINCNLSAPTSCALPLSSMRNGIPLTFKDIGGTFGAYSLTLTTVEAIDGQPSIVLNGNYQELTAVPLNDGTNTGWAIE